MPKHKNPKQIIEDKVTDDDILNANQAAKCLGVSDRTLETMVHDGVLPFYRLGDRMRRFRRGDLLTFLATRRIEAKSKKKQEKVLA
jgi:excisionase family DNA binding protein